MVLFNCFHRLCSEMFPLLQKHFISLAQEANLLHLPHGINSRPEICVDFSAGKRCD